MNFNAKFLPLFSFVLVLFLATTVSAKDVGPYVNANIGKTDVDVDMLDFDKGTSFSFGVGYSFNKHVSVEANYIDFGDMEDDIDPVFTLSGDALVVSAIGKIPFSDNFSGFARLGFFSWDAEVNAAGFGEIASDDGTDLTYGLGLLIDFNENISGLIQYQKFDFETDGEDIDADNLSLGLQVFF